MLSAAHLQPWMWLLGAELEAVSFSVNLTRFSCISRGHSKHRTQTGIDLKIFCRFGGGGGITKISFTKCSLLSYSATFTYSIQCNFCISYI